VIKAISVAVTTMAAATVLAYSAYAQFVSGAAKIKFPENHANGVLYTTVDRADNKQYRELFATPEALAAAKKGEPLPVGTVLTLIQYKASPAFSHLMSASRARIRQSCFATTT
jgi:hypothetical protein